MSLLRPRWLLLAASSTVAGASLWWLLSPADAEPKALPAIDRVDTDYVAPIPIDLAISASLFAEMPQADLVNAGNASGAGDATSLQPPRLVGLALRGKSAVALAVDQSGQTLLLHPGDVIDGWTLASAGRDNAMFSLGDRQVRVALDFSNKTGAASSTGAATQQLADTPAQGEVVSGP
jgi:hypothetical protein